LNMVQVKVKTLAWVLGAIGSLAAVTAFGVAPLTASDAQATDSTVEAVSFQPEVIESRGTLIQQERIRRGETLGTLLSRLGADDAEFGAFVRKDPFAKSLLELRPGRTVSAVLGTDRSIDRLTYRLSSADPVGLGRRLVIARQSGKLVAYDEPVPAERSIETRTALVRNSLVEALDAADIPDNVLTRMADVFGEDVNLRDVRRGDRLRVVYETLQEAGSLEPPIVGRILAVQFRGGQRKIEAIWFNRGDGVGDYYSFDGRNLSRPFLASPLEFTRVSSGFTESRLHPILRDWRAHKGVDLQAPVGTKVRSTADGVIDFVGQQRGYGNVIIIKHNAKQTTLYAHLNEFADGLQVGSKVRQGDTIGTVGMTGWTTGPHLHFEFLIDGEHVDPMAAVQAIPVRGLQGAERARFTAQANEYKTRFGLLDTQMVARFE
ncbi:MAG: M23 family metallopeptidase, partial [Burkholderiales bacterium]|nr:M23 family metallopeptidase [Burkholderiales bacterium]